jgi:hypothetical protein
LRGGGVTLPAKRRQRSDEPCNPASKESIWWEPTPLLEVAAASRYRKKAWYAWSRRGRRAGRVWTGVHPGTWEAQVVPLEGPVGAHRIRKPRPVSERLSLDGSEKKQAKSGNRLAKETKRDGTAAWDSEPFIVPRKQANLPKGSLWREGGAGSCRLQEGTMGETLSSQPITTKQLRIACLDRGRASPVGD